MGIGLSSIGLGLATGGKPAPFSPAAVAGLQLWLDAASSPVWQDAGGTVAATADGDPVRRWDDLSGNSRHVTAPSDAARPSLKLAIQNGKPVLRFDGVDDYLVSASAAQSQAVTVFVVVNLTVVGNYPHVVATGTGNAWNLRAVGTLGLWSFQYAVNNQGPALASNSAGTGFHLLSASATDGAWSVALDNNTPAAGAISSTFDTPKTYQVGDRDDRQGYLLPGDIAELLVYNSVLSADDTAAVKAYLNAKWNTYGLQLWLDASTSPKWQDAAGTIPAVADSDPVRRWDDLSGCGRHVTAPSDATRPTLKLSQQNGLPALRFDGVDDYLTAARTGFTGDVTIFAVCRFSSLGMNWAVIAEHSSNGSQATWNIACNFGNVTHYGMWQTGGGADVSSTSALSTDTPYLLVGRRSGSSTNWSLSLRKNGSADGSTTSGNNAQTFDGCALAVGRIGGYGGFYLPGDVMECRVYNVALSPSEIAAVEAYLNAKWGIY